MKVRIKRLKKTGKDWKKFYSGLDKLNDDAIYQFNGDILLNSFNDWKNAVRLFLNKPKKTTIWHVTEF